MNYYLCLKISFHLTVEESNNQNFDEIYFNSISIYDIM
jgi:hypothetical protein